MPSDRGRSRPAPKGRYPRARRRRFISRPKYGPHHIGRFFRPARKYKGIRLDMKPYHLGECDWLLYRKKYNPYRLTTRKGKAYDRGFEDCRRDEPKPSWPPL